MTATETQRAPWTTQEDTVIHCCAKLHGPDWAGWAHVLPGRTAEEAVARIPWACPASSRPKGGPRQGYPRTGAPWSAEEVDALRSAADMAGATLGDVLEAVPGRSPRSVRAKAAHLGIPMPPAREPWSAEEDARLKDHFPAHGNVWVGWRRVLPGRSARSIEERSRELGITRMSGNRHWTDQELEILVTHWERKGSAWEGWAHLLPGRTETAIRAKIKHLCSESKGQGTQSWTSEELRRLRVNYPLHGPSWEGWAKVLPGRTPAIIAAKARYLRIPAAKSSARDKTKSRRTS